MMQRGQTEVFLLPMENINQKELIERAAAQLFLLPMGNINRSLGEPTTRRSRLSTPYGKHKPNSAAVSQASHTAFYSLWET